MLGVQLRRIAPVLALGLLALTAIIVQLTPTPALSSPQGTDAPGASASGGAQAQAGPGGAPTEAVAPARLVTARRGTLTETMTLAGRVGGADEVAASFQAPQRVAKVYVKPGDQVTAGQVLAEADAREIARNLADARDRLTGVLAKFERGQQQAASQQLLAERGQAVAQAKAQRSITDAESAVRRAQADLERVRGGASQAERRVAETTEAAARAGLARAESDLVRLQKGPSDLDLRQAQQQVVATELALQKAQTEYQRLAQGPDPVQLRSAQLEYMQAQNALTRAQADLQRLVAGDPVARAAAERDVQRARTALQLARMPRASASGNGSSTTRPSAADTRADEAARRAAIQDAQFALQGATDRLNALQAGPPPAEMLMAQRAVSAAASTLDGARTRLEQVAQGPDQVTINQARANLDAAQLAYDGAVARLTALYAGPDPEAFSAAQAAYAGAAAALRAAQVQQQDLLARPTQAELADAEDRLKLAQEALTLALADTPVTDPVAPDQASPDLAMLQQAVQQEQSAVAALERDLADTSLVAPLDGTVSAILAKEGYAAGAGEPVVVVTPADAERVVLADLPVADGARLTRGQQATMQYGGVGGDPSAPIADLSDLGDGRLRVTVRPTWPADRPAFGAPVSLRVTMQERPGVLILPIQALQGFGNQRSVQVLDGDQPRTVPVTVGLIDGEDAEIVSGIDANATVLVPR